MKEMKACSRGMKKVTELSMRRICLSVVTIFAFISSSTAEDFGTSDSHDDNNEFYAERVDTTVQCSLDHTAIVTLYLEGDSNMAVLPGDQGFIRPTLPPASAEHGDITGTHDLDWSQLFGNDETETQSPTSMMNATTFISPANYSDDDNNRTSDYNYGFNESSVTATAAPGVGVEHRFRECWCAPFVLPTSYYRRQAFYCLEEFDTCQVHGRSGTIACFSSPKRTTFVRGFWPVCLFWYGALLYIFFASEQGQLARQYMKRGIFSFILRSIGLGGNRRQGQGVNEANATSNGASIPQQQSPAATNNDNVGGTADSDNVSPQSEQAQEVATSTSPAQNNTSLNDGNASRSTIDDINQRMLEYELDRMRQDHPSRLSWLLQSAMARERNARWRQIRQLQIEQERQIRREARDMRRQERQQHQASGEQDGEAATTIVSGAAENSNGANDVDGNPSGGSNADNSDGGGSSGSTEDRPARIRRFGPFALGSASTRTDGTTRATEASAFTPPPNGTPGLFSPGLALAAFTTTRLQPTLSLKTKVFKGVSTVNSGQDESDEEDDFDEFDDSSDDEPEHDEESNLPSVASTASETCESGDAEADRPIQLPKRKKRFPRCAICLVRVEIGDVIGDIACGHVFHKACIKSWLKKGINKCPLCQRTGIATPSPLLIAPHSVDINGVDENNI